MPVNEIILVRPPSQWLGPTTLDIGGARALTGSQPHLDLRAALPPHRVNGPLSDYLALLNRPIIQLSFYQLHK